MAVILRWLKRIAIGFVVFLLVAYAGLWLMFRYASVSTHGDVDLGVGNVVVPVERAHAWMAQSVVTDSVLVSTRDWGLAKGGQGLDSPNFDWETCNGWGC